MKLTISQLKDELASRGAPRTGQLKSVLHARGFARSSLRIMPWQQHTSAVVLRLCVRGAVSGAVLGVKI